MKRKLLLFLVLATLTVPLSAQTRYTAAVVNDVLFGADNGYPCPVANINLSYSLAAVKINSTLTAFYMIDHDAFIAPPLPTLIVLPPAINANAAYYAFNSPITDFTVNDMVVVNQYAFFCGTINGTDAFYGYFNYGVLITGASNDLTVYIYLLGNMVPTTAPVTLKKMVAYKEEENYKVVAIGDEDFLPDYCTSKVVEIFDATGSPTCKVADMPNYSFESISQKIFLDDIVLTDDYVVVLGHDVGIVEPCTDVQGTRFPWFSMGKRANVVGDISDIVNSPNYFLPSTDEVFGKVRGVALGNDKFAMAYLYYERGTDTYYTRFRVIDVIPGMYSISIYNTYSQQFITYRRDGPVDMTYLKSISKVELLQPIYNLSDFVQLTPYATSNYSTTMLSPNGHIFLSLDRLSTNYSSRFISTRNSEFYIQDMTASLPHSNVICPVNNDLDVDIIEELPIEQYPCPIESGGNELMLFFAPDEYFHIITAPLNSQCFSYE